MVFYEHLVNFLMKFVQGPLVLYYDICMFYGIAEHFCCFVLPRAYTTRKADYLSPLQRITHSWASTSATRWMTSMILSGFNDIESIPCLTRKAAKSG